MSLQTFVPVLSKNYFSRLDVAFAQFLTERCRLENNQQNVFFNLVAQLSYQQSQGHSCIRLSKEAVTIMLASKLVTDASLSEQKTLPLVIQNQCLYTQRYYFYESRLAAQLKTLLQQPLATQIQSDLLEIALTRHFSPLENNETDWQRAAAKTALTHGFSIVTGGPGTGKTTTVVKILALLQEFSQPFLHIVLAAPTGKAAMRLQESIGGNIEKLNCDAELKQHIPQAVSTIHRLLGAKPLSPYFKHHADNPLPYDVIVIDEASMVDLALMSKLVDALKQEARLILLGDKDQLASVESGSVLADLTSCLTEQTVELKKSHRFHGIIKDLAVAINQQQAQLAWELLEQQGEIISLLKTDLIDYVANKQKPYLDMIKHGADFKSIFEAFNEFQVLCSNRRGINSIEDINFKVEKKLGLSAHWYVGRPVMISENNPALQLYNGDIGLCLEDENRRLMVYFLCPDGETIKKVLPSRLPKCDTVFAMTIHKSQGSEFEEVLMVLPDVSNRVLNKELIYTAITRAKTTVKIVANKTVFLEAVGKKVQRFGGLKSKMRTT